MSMVFGARGSSRPDRRKIHLAALLFFGLFTLTGTLAELGVRNARMVIIVNAVTNIPAVFISLGISRRLDVWRERAGRDPIGRILALVVAASIVTGAACGLLSAINFRKLDQFASFSLPQVVQAFVLYLLWALLHLAIRSGERALAQERRIAAAREAILADENEALLYRLDPTFVVEALFRIEGSLARGARETAGATVIGLAEHMRSTLGERLPPGAAALAARLEDLEAAELSGAQDELDVPRRFLVWTGVIWLGLLAMLTAIGALSRHGVLAYLEQLGAQPVLGALCCLSMERGLRRWSGRPLRQVYAAAALLGLLSLAVVSAALYASTAAMGRGRVYPFSELPGLEAFYMLPAFLAWTAAWFVMDARRREIARLRSAAEIREAALKARNAMLRQQINPHFLFNALNALYALVLDGETARAQRVIAAIRNFVERAGDPAHGDLVALSRELATQDAYLEIERVRFGDRLQVARDVASELQAARVPHLILQPLVENAIKYGVSRTDAPVRVEISAARSGEELVLQVRDTGAPEAAPRPPGLGVGLKNVEGRLRSLYGDAGRLACRELDPSGFLAEVRLPLVL